MQLTEFLITLFSVFGLTVVLLHYIIPILKSRKLGQSIKEIGPRWHKSKEGTPVMGGIGFIIAILAVVLIITVVSFIRGRAKELIPLALALGLAVANACDALKELADQTICDNSEHIAKYVLENFIL